MLNDQSNAAPGIGPTQAVDYRRVMLADEQYLPGSFIIDGENARDPGHSKPKLLRAGLLLGRITASKKFGASILGTVTAAYSDGGTSLTVSAAAAGELVGRIGSSGTFQLVSAPTATGTVATDQVTYSAVNTTNGVITVTDIGKDVIVGSLLQPEDGSETIRTFLYNGYPIKAVDANDADRDIEMGRYTVGGLVKSDELINWPPSAATSLHAWLVDQLNAAGSFRFTHQHGV